MGWGCRTHQGDIRNAYKAVIVHAERKKLHLRYPGADTMITVCQCVVKK